MNATAVSVYNYIIELFYYSAWYSGTVVQWYSSTYQYLVDVKPHRSRLP